MNRSRLLSSSLLVGLVCLASGCTSFADRDTGAAEVTDPPAGSASGTSAPEASAAPSDELVVTDETDLGVGGDTLTSARVVVSPDGTPTTLLITSSGATAVTDGVPTTVGGTVVTDLVGLPDGPLALTLTADAVSPDPVLGLLRLDAGQLPNGSGATVPPTPLDPQQTAPRGLPAFAAAGPDGDVLYVLAEDTDGVTATVYAVDPATGALQDSATVDPGRSDVTALELGGLTVTGDGDLVVGLTLASDDELAAGGSASMLLRLDADLGPSGRPVDAQPDDRRAPVLAVTTDDDGEPTALLADPDEGLVLVRPDLDAGVPGLGPVADPELGTRATGLAVASSTAVTAVLDQGSPTVAVASLGGATPTTVELCAGEGEAMAVAVGPDDTVLVAGTCDGESRLWTLG